MGRAPCCDKASVKKGPWSPEEDAKLKTYIDHHGTGGSWITLPQRIGLKRCGKGCRLRWLNYLRPNLKHGSFSEEEDYIIYSLYANIGSRWSIMAAQLPGRTDNDIKNHWNTKLKKKLLVLGNQRKEQLQTQAHRVCSMNQEMKIESENWEIMSQTPHWPKEHSLTNHNVSNTQDYDLNNQVSSLKSFLITKLEGVEFSYDLQQPYTNMMSSQSSCDIPFTMNMINSSPISTTCFPTNTFQEFGYFPNDLSHDLVGCVNSPQIDGSMKQFFGGIESMDVAHGSSCMTSTESTSWEDISSLVYSPLVYNYQAC